MLERIGGQFVSLQDPAPAAATRRSDFAAVLTAVTRQSAGLLSFVHNRATLRSSRQITPPDLRGFRPPPTVEPDCAFDARGGAVAATALGGVAPIRPVFGTISRRIIERPGEGHGSVQAPVAVGEHALTAHVEQLQIDVGPHRLAARAAVADFQIDHGGVSLVFQVVGVASSGAKARAHAGGQRGISGVGHQRGLAFEDVDEFVLAAVRVAQRRHGSWSERGQVDAEVRQSERFTELALVSPGHHRGKRFGINAALRTHGDVAGAQGNGVVGFGHGQGLSHQVGRLAAAASATPRRREGLAPAEPSRAQVRRNCTSEVKPASAAACPTRAPARSAASAVLRRMRCR